MPKKNFYEFLKKIKKTVDNPFLYMLQWSCFGSLAQLGEHLPYKQEVIGSIPITSTKLNHSTEWFFNYPFAEVVEWQTRRTQNPLLATTCGFKSRLRHQYNLFRKEQIFLSLPFHHKKHRTPEKYCLQTF